VIADFTPFIILVLGTLAVLAPDLNIELKARDDHDEQH
jgi:hypothetical protein